MQLDHAAAQECVRRERVEARCAAVEEDASATHVGRGAWQSPRRRPGRRRRRHRVRRSCGRRYGRRLPGPFLPRAGEGRSGEDHETFKDAKAGSAYRHGAMAKISVTMLGQFGVTVDTVPVDEQPLGPAPRGRAREGARPRSGPATAPGAGARPPLARRHRRRGGTEAAQGRPLRPRVPSTCRTRSCSAATPSRSAPRPRPWSTWCEFEELARRALADADVVDARAALALYGGELLPDDRYEDWAEERREQLRLRHLDLLRLDGRWEAVVELDPSDEVAHLALMRRHAANGDRHAALRQFERMDRALRR